MRKWIGWILVLALLCGLTASAAATQPAGYQLGDKMDDFSVTLADGSETSLYGLLKEKKAVLLNFWASWCSPCMMEFPYLEQAYAEASDEVGVIALSCEATDTNEIVLSLKKEMGLDTLPMGLDNGLAERFQINAYPTSIIVDRNGIICFREAGSIPDKDKFLRLFSVFTGEGYQEPVMLEEIPAAKVDIAYPAAEELAKALQMTDERIEILIPEDETVWPFVPATDGACIQAANGNVKGTKAVLTMNVTAKAGEALAYDYAVSCTVALDSLTVTVDGDVTKFYGGIVDWSSDHITFAADGVHTVAFSFTRHEVTPSEQGKALLRGLRMISAEEEAALAAQAPVKPKTLEGTACSIEPAEGNYRQIVMTQSIPGSGESTETTAISFDDTITMRVKIGKDVDETLAFVALGNEGTLLSYLPYDEEGYLFTAPIATAKGPNDVPGNAFVVYPSVLNLETGIPSSYTCFGSEADVDAYVKMCTDWAVSTGVEDYSLTWEYTDGAPRGAAPEEAEAPADDGMATYVIAVVDEAGAAVPGAMIQICDEATCQVGVTDQDGRVTHQAAPYPLEIHLLKAPEGFAPHTDTYTMPTEGGEITITLKKE